MRHCKIFANGAYRLATSEVEQRAEFHQLLFHERSNGVEQKGYEREERQKELAPKKLERIQPWTSPQKVSSSSDMIHEFRIHNESSVTTAEVACLLIYL